MPTLLFVFGTRPEAIKLCPVILHLRERYPSWTVKVCATAQHRAMLDQVLELFGIEPDYDLNIMAPGQSLFQSTSRILAALEPVLAAAHPGLVVVQGDTTTTLCGALAGFYARVPVAHVEAGLRTGDLVEPFPEELNRVLVGRMTALHFAATSWAAENLCREGVDPARIVVTGNPGIDAVLYVRDRLRAGLAGCPIETDAARRLILVTAHRRESFGEGFECICDALLELAARPDVEIAYPVHPNPRVRETVRRRLEGHARIRLLEPQGYVAFIDLLLRAGIVLTDSGGIQEEAPSLGKPVLVMREKTERPEGVAAGTVRLVGNRDARRIVDACTQLLDDPGAYREMARAHSPYGDGQASRRIGEAIEAFLADGSQLIARG
jgi:UDP-N-acetylglucosamine 2-epimerase (non-hydrolysing)